MRRREFIALFGGVAAAASGATAQTPSRVYRVGLLSTAAALANDSEQGAAFVRGMRQAGYVLGQNLAIERRGAMGRIEQLPALAHELIAAGADVLVVNGFRTALAAKATGHPTVVASELSTKRLGLLKELVPGLRQVAMLWNQDDLGMTLRYRASAQAAESLGVRVQALGVREPDDFEAAFAAMNADRPDAILMVADTLTNLNRKRVFDFAVEHRLPAIYELAFLVRDGGLMSYGPDLRELYERAAALVDRILKGAKPADLPFEQPTRYLFAVNLKTAKAIGLEVPPLLLARADEVIE
jgi:putative ABC transport system substrate-binding protein